MTTYKEVFQLAQDKGFFKNVNNKSLFEEITEVQKSYVGKTKQICYLLQLTLIQKWLRDEYKIFCWVQLNGNSIRQHYIPLLMTNLNPNNTIEFSKYDTYEQALLEGISEGLKLI
jgi:hypothetical protein